MSDLTLAVWMLMDLDRLQLGFVHRTGFDLMRVAIVNWLRSKIPELSDLER